MPPRLPDSNWDLSPFTGYTRAHWQHTAELLLAGAHRHASAGHSLIKPPGPTSKYGARSDGLEGFARAFLLAACLVAGNGGDDPHGHLERYAEGLATGTDPQAADRWPSIEEVQQAKVEAGGLAIGLHLTRPWLWDRLAAPVQERILAWFSTVIGADYPPINWLWFKLLAQTFSRSVGGPWSLPDITATLEITKTFAKPDGWCCDGPERAYDHYTGWVLQMAPLIWAQIAGPELCPAALRSDYLTQLADFLPAAVRLVGADGSPLLQGRTLTYRWAAAAPFWVAAWSGVDILGPGLLRRAASGMLRHFLDRGNPDPDGVLSVGWHGPWTPIAQAYTGSGSPYWVANGMLGLLLPGDHPVWTAPEQPLPIETGDDLSVADSPGWLISGTRADGIVRVINHGTDHSIEGDLRSDSPLYARLGYSTSTCPPLTGPTLASPVDNSVVLFDASGRASSRNGFQRIRVGLAGKAATAVSRSRVHWVHVEDDSSDDHGSGRTGRVELGPWLTVGSAIKGAVEIRAARVDVPADQARIESTLRFGGWPVAGERDLTATVFAAHHEGSGPVASVTLDDPTPTEAPLVSSVTGIAGVDEAGVDTQDGASPLGRQVGIPWVATAQPAEPGRVYLARVSVAGQPISDQVTVTCRPTSSADLITIAWPDGDTTSLELPYLQSQH